jgi:hypothetical protein
MHLRDLAMMIVSAHGPSYRDNFLVIEYRAARGDQPHGLDVWQKDDRTTKVLCMFWSDADAVVISYRSGPWERALARAAAAAFAA